jgi:hypothetical protein
MKSKKTTALIGITVLSFMGFASKMVSVDGNYFVPEINTDPFATLFFKAPSMVQLMSGNTKGCAEVGVQTTAVKLTDISKIQQADKDERAILLGQPFCRKVDGTLVFKTAKDGVELEVNINNDIRLISEQQRISGDAGTESGSRTSSTGKGSNPQRQGSSPERQGSSSQGQGSKEKNSTI